MIFWIQGKLPHNINKEASQKEASYIHKNHFTPINPSSYFTLSTYSPVLVFIRMSSPSFTNKGTFTVAPVSTFAGFNVLVAVSPLNPGSLYVTFTTILSGNSTLIGKSVSVLIRILTSWPSFKNRGASTISSCKLTCSKVSV